MQRSNQCAYDGVAPNSGRFGRQLHSHSLGNWLEIVGAGKTNSIDQVSSKSVS